MDSVLVVIVYTNHKKYCKHIYPKIYNCLNYSNKSLAFIDEQNYPVLGRQNSGEQRASTGRQIGIDIARKQNPDWVFMLDFDTEPDPDAIQKMLKVKHPLIGSMHCARGNPWQCIGHNYIDRKSKKRVWLTRQELRGYPEVDGISGGHMMIARGIYNRVDYLGYMGPGTIPLRFTADDEYLQIKIFESMKIRPKVATDVFSWHYSDDGRAYRLWGKVKQWRAY